MLREREDRKTLCNISVTSPRLPLPNVFLTVLTRETFTHVSRLWTVLQKIWRVSQCYFPESDLLNVISWKAPIRMTSSSPSKLSTFLGHSRYKLLWPLPSPPPPSLHWKQSLLKRRDVEPLMLILVLCSVRSFQLPIRNTFTAIT